MAEEDANATFVPGHPDRIRIRIDGTDYEFKQGDCISFTTKQYNVKNNKLEIKDIVTIGNIVIFDYNPTLPNIVTKILCRTYKHGKLEEGPLLKIGLQIVIQGEASDVDWRTIRPCQALASGGRRKKRRHATRGRRRRSSRRRTSTA